MNKPINKRLSFKLLLLIPFCLMLFFFVGNKAAYAAAGTLYESEPNNTYGRADLTYDDYDNYGYISPDSDVDWWKVKFNSSGSANFWLGNVPSGCDYDLRVYSSNGTTLLRSSTNSGNANELITMNVSANVYYYIKINSYSGSSSSSRYLFRTKIYPDPPILTKSDLRNATINFVIPMEDGGFGIYGYGHAHVNYNLFVNHQVWGTTRRITKVTHYVQARKLDPALGTLDVTAAWTGIEYVYNGVSTRRSAYFDGSGITPPNCAWDNKVETQGFSYYYTHMLDVNAEAFITCSGAINSPVVLYSNLIVP